MRPGNELLPHVATLGEADGVQAVQVILQWDGMTYTHSPTKYEACICMHEPLEQREPETLQLYDQVNVD